MSSKGGGTQGYRFYMSMLMGFGRGPMDEMVEIKVGDKTAWLGHACDDTPGRINKPDLFGGDDKEGGIDGSFQLLLGGDDQVVPASIKESIRGFVSDFRGVTTFWFDGMVAAMSPYLKPWKFRVRRYVSGWHGQPWYPSKAAILMGGDVLTVETNQPGAWPVTVDFDGNATITFSSNPQAGDSVTVNGQSIGFVDSKKPEEDELKPSGNTADTVRRLAALINKLRSRFKASATADGNKLTLSGDKQAAQIYAMNGAHAIYQCYTDPLWGRGFDITEMDDNSWTYAANQLCAEGFGLALVWYRKEDIEAFIQKLSDLIGAVTYTDRETGLTAIKLIRNDYDPATIPYFTPETGLLSIDEDDSASADNSYNEIIGSSVDPVTNLAFQVRAQNPAARMSQGSVSSLDQDYKGIPTKALLSRVVLRDLRAMASGLKKYTLTLDRRAWRLTPGSVIRVSHPGKGINSVILRVGDIDDGNMVNGRIVVKAAIDVFGLPETSYFEPVDSSFEAPTKEAVPPPYTQPFEPTYRDVYRRLGGADTLALDPDAGFAGGMAAAPSPLLLEYIFKARFNNTDRVYPYEQPGQFTGYAILDEDQPPYSTVWPYDESQSFDAENIGQALFVTSFDEESGGYIGYEIVRLDAIDTAAKTITVARGCADTFPMKLVAGSIIWTVDDDLVTITDEFARGDMLRTTFITRSTEGQSSPEDLGTDQFLGINGRHARPYLPAHIEWDDNPGKVSIFDPIQHERKEPTLTWVDRNRVTQADKLVGHFEDGAILAEPNTSYRIEIRGGGFLLRTVVQPAAVDGNNSFTYTAAMQAEDFADNSVEPSVLQYRMYTVRDGIDSNYFIDFTATIKGGWGYSWGSDWGGS